MLQNRYTLASRTLVLLLAVTAIVATNTRAPRQMSLGSTAPVASTAAVLTWAPPVLVNPITVRLNATGAQTVTMDNSRDYLIVLPSVKRVGATNLVGGRNVIVKGGYTTLPAGSGAFDRSFTITDRSTGMVSGRIVHIEGVRIDGSGGGLGDGIGIKAPSAIVQLENMRVTGLLGSMATVHADVVQVFGGVKELRIDRFTGASHYNDLYLRRENSPLELPPGVVRISNTNMFGYVNPAGSKPATTIRAISLGTQPADTDGGPSNIASGTNCGLVNNVYLSSFYGQPPGTLRAGQDIYPHDRMSGAATSCLATVSADGRTADWAGWRNTKVFGVVNIGAPPGGDFVPDTSTVGLGYTSPAYRSLAVAPLTSDFNGDGRTDLAVFRPSTSVWYLRGISAVKYGTTGDIPVSADYNGDGRTDIAVFRPSTGIWYLRGFGAALFGATADIPAVADYNGDGRADIAVYRPSTGIWYLRGFGAARYGATGDIPVAADYNGDGRAEMAVYRPSTGIWYLRGGLAARYGATGDVPSPADYNGDRRSDIAVFRPHTGIWYLRGMTATKYGANGDIPVAADYNSDRRADIAVFRPSTGIWYLRGITALAYGVRGDIPLS